MWNIEMRLLPYSKSKYEPTTRLIETHPPFETIPQLITSSTRPCPPQNGRTYPETKTHHRCYTDSPPYTD